MNKEKLNQDIDRLKEEFDIFKNLEMVYNPILRVVPARIENPEVSCEDNEIVSFKWYNKDNNALLSINITKENTKVVFTSDKKDFKSILKLCKPKYCTKLVLMNKKELINILYTYY